MKQLEILAEALATKKVVKTSDLLSAGIYRQTISQAVEDGALDRVAHGVYAHPEAKDYQFYDYAVLCTITGGVIHDLTAAAAHGISNAIAPADICLLVPNAYNNRDLARDLHLPVRMTRTRRDKLLSVGVEDFDAYNGLTFRVTSEARTVVDLYANIAHRQHALDGLADYLQAGRSIPDLMEMAEIFGQDVEIRAQLEILGLVRERGLPLK